MTERNKAIPAAYVILEEDGKILVGRRCNTGYQDGNYQLPAGHVESGELPGEAMIREAKEELGIDIDLEDLVCVHISYRPKHDDTDNRVDFFFKAKKWSGEIQNMEPNKCDELRWVDPDDLPENFTPHVRDAIASLNQDVFYKELGFDYLRAQGLIR